MTPRGAAIGLAAALALASPAAGAASPDSSEPGDSSAPRDSSVPHDSSAPRDLQPAARVQRRFVEKRGRLVSYAGFAWLSRGDFYRSPGVELSVSYYVFESLAVDLRGAWFFSRPTDELREVVARTGFIPDSRPSKAALLIGARYSIGYAKMKLPGAHVLHFDPQLFLYGGVHFTSGDFADTRAAPLGELGLGLLLYATPRVQARLDAGVTVEGEQRTQYVAVVGAYPVVSLGVMF